MLRLLGKVKNTVYSTGKSRGATYYLLAIADIGSSMLKELRLAWLVWLGG